MDVTCRAGVLQSCFARCAEPLNEFLTVGVARGHRARDTLAPKLIERVVEAHEKEFGSAPTFRLSHHVNHAIDLVPIGVSPPDTQVAFLVKQPDTVAAARYPSPAESCMRPYSNDIVEAQSDGVRPWLAQMTPPDL